MVSIVDAVSTGGQTGRNLRANSVQMGKSASEIQRYDDFVRRYGLEEARASEPPALRSLRSEIFATRLAAVRAHNARGDQLWTASVNSFADQTDDELRHMLGYKRGAGLFGSGAPSFLASASAAVDAPARNRSTLPKEVDWRGRLHSLKYLRSQGTCGSCWAVAAVGALETHAELAHGNVTELSYDHLVQCVENPHRCGGSGGCDGATSELAFDYAREHGVATASGYYNSLLGDSVCEPPAKERMFAEGYVRLPSNRQRPLMEALASKGPVVVSVDATAWFAYDTGIFDGCDRDAVVNHAVLMVGYGAQRKVRYWTIRNSWGGSWGEGGYIRLLRLEGEESYCGVDRKPEEGVGCAGGPKEMQVCGVCGVLTDSSYPTGVRLERAADAKASIRAQTPGALPAR